MALEVAASIIGILAAAGKVVETLGPVVSSYRDSAKNAAAVIAEVNDSRVLLGSLQHLLGNLDEATRVGRAAVSVEHLVAVLTNGVLLYSELASLVDQWKDTGFSFSKKVTWIWNEKSFTTLLSRIQSFKSSVSVILNILQCESDAKAERERQKFFSLITTLMADNLDLRQRMAHVEDCYMKRDSIRASTVLEDDANNRLLQTNRRMSNVPFMGSTPTGFLFDSDLAASRVYRKIKRFSMDLPSRISIANSHAWSALSDVSLSDISAISVVALPISPADLTNAHLYHFQDSSMRTHIQDISIVQADDKHKGNPNVRISRYPARREARSGSTHDQLAQSLNVEFHNEYNIVVMGTTDSGAPEIVSSLAGSPFQLHQNMESMLVTSYKSDLEVGQKMIQSRIDVLHPLGGLELFSPTSYQLKCMQRGNLFMLIFNIVSEESWYWIQQIPPLIAKVKGKDYFPIIMVANCRAYGDNGRSVVRSEAARMRAFSLGCDFARVLETDWAFIRQPFFDLVRAKWAYEKRVREGKHADERLILLKQALGRKGSASS